MTTIAEKAIEVRKRAEKVQSLSINLEVNTAWLENAQTGKYKFYLIAEGKDTRTGTVRVDATTSAHQERMKDIFEEVIGGKVEKLYTEIEKLSSTILE